MRSSVLILAVALALPLPVLAQPNPLAGNTPDDVPEPAPAAPLDLSKPLPPPPPSTLPASPVPAFPGAIGFGRHATGGRGGHVVRVTTLADAGPGSFREAVSQPNRIVVFAVAGTIELNPHDIPELADNLTLLGQTAPGPGITITGSQVGLSHRSNLIIRYVRFRQGMADRQAKKYTLGMRETRNAIIDHCDIQLGRWDCIGFSKGADVTFSNNIIGQSIDPQRFGGLIESDYVTFARNLWIHNQSRNPKAKGKIQYINNVVYNWGVGGLVGGHSAAPHWLDAVNNVFIAGPNSRPHRWTGDYTATDQVFHAGNLVDLDPDGTLTLRPGDPKEFADDKGAPTLLSAPSLQPADVLTTDLLPPEQTLEHVLQTAGVSHRRDPLDLRLIEEVRSFGTKGQIYKDPAPLFAELAALPKLAALHAPPEPDSDADGLPDAWETAHGLNPNDPTDSAKIDPATGYAHIELYANSLVTPK